MCQCDRERFILERGEIGEIFCGNCGKNFIGINKQSVLSKCKIIGCDEYIPQNNYCEDHDSTNELKCTRCEEKLIIDKMNHEISCKNGHVYHNDDIVKNYNIIVNRLRESLPKLVAIMVKNAIDGCYDHIEDLEAYFTEKNPELQKILENKK